jgi:hypothetical protein
VAEKFCEDMETIPVAILAGLFHAISQKSLLSPTRRHVAIGNYSATI